jgi:hypothetical protein
MVLLVSSNYETPGNYVEIHNYWKARIEISWKIVEMAFWSRENLPVAWNCLHDFQISLEF